MPSEGNEASAFWQPPPEQFTLGPCIGGRRGVTRVFAARDASGIPCALKTLHPDAAARPINVVRFASEVRAHLDASRIDGVAIAVTPADTFAWLQIAWAHGGDVAMAIERSAIVRQRVAAFASQYAMSLLRTVAELHRVGIVHRDIKPSNLLLDGGALWLTDFGIAGRRHLDAGVACWRALPEPWRERSVGTAPWAAPELALAIPMVTTASDVYSIALVWQWMRTVSAAAVPLRASEDEIMRAMLDADVLRRPTANEALSTLTARV